MNNMRHMDYIEKVADDDIDCLRQKEATYKGSWKSQGGKNAWAMIRRKIDRLMIMLGDPTPPKHFNLTNVDDTISAVVNGTKLPGSQQATAEILGFLRDSFTAGDIFAQIEVDRSGADGTVLAEVRDLRRYLLLVEAEIVSRHKTAGVAAAPVERAAGNGHDVDADESRHGSEYPYRLTNMQFKKIFDRVPSEAEAFWTRRGEHWIVDAHVQCPKMPRELAGMFIADDNDGWLIDINLVPPHVRELFPLLHLERNMFEHGELPAWQQPLYHLVNEKMVLKNTAWHASND